LVTSSRKHLRGHLTLAAEVMAEITIQQSRGTSGTEARGTAMRKETLGHRLSKGEPISGRRTKGELRYAGQL
jgi:hypothetical protein